MALVPRMELSNLLWGILDQGAQILGKPEMTATKMQDGGSSALSCLVSQAGLETLALYFEFERLGVRLPGRQTDKEPGF